MTLMEALDVISRWAHVGTAIVLVGGSVFMRFILAPAAAQLPDAEHQTLRGLVLGRWKRVVHGGIAVFIVSGFYNYFRLRGAHEGDGPYHMLIGIKMLIAFVIFFLASALVGRSEKFAPMRQNNRKWLAIVILLAAIVVGISGFLKVRGVPAPAAPDAPPVASTL